MKIYGDKEVWLVTGSQDLYGPGVLKQVAENSQKIAAGLNESNNNSIKIVAQDTVKSPKEILAVCQPANSNPNAVASHAIKSAIGRLGTTSSSTGGRRAQQGRWVRRGNSIIILGA